MGIQGLIPFLEKASRPINLSDYSGFTVGIDAYCWLHKGIFTCADKLSKGESSTLYVNYCMKLVNMLLSYNIKPILVFDGQRLVAKGETENKRRETREMNRKKGAELLRLDKAKEAEVYLRRCIDVTHEMAKNLMSACRLRNVDCIVAPYEADAQLAYFSMNDIVDLIVTEDSDLLLFGAKKVLFKMDQAGNGLLIEQDRLHIALDIKKENFDMDKFRYMCMLSGCDYLPNLRGIGLMKAQRFIKKVTDTNIHRAISRLGSYLNMPQLNVTLEYRNSFIAADAAFLYHPVFDPFTRTIVPLNAFPSDITTIPDYLLKIPLSKEQAIQLCYGNLDPGTLERVDSWDPSMRSAVIETAKLNHRGNASIAPHISIWDEDYLNKRQSMIARSRDKSSSASPDSTLCLKSSTFGKKLIQNVFFKKHLESPLSGEASGDCTGKVTDSIKQIASEYRSQNIECDEMQVSSSCFDDSVHELNENTTDTVGDSSLGKRKRKHVDMNDSCHVVSRYFVSPQQKNSLKRLDTIDNLDSLERKLSKIEKSIYDDTAMVSDNKNLTSRNVQAKMKSPLKQQNESAPLTPVSNTRQMLEQFSLMVSANSDDDVNKLIEKQREDDDPKTSENSNDISTTSSLSPIFQPSKRRNPFAVSPEIIRNSNRQQESLFKWKDYLQNQFSYAKSRNKDECNTDNTDVHDVGRQFRNPVLSSNKSVPVDSDRGVIRDQSIADIMTEDEDEGFFSPSFNKDDGVIDGIVTTDEISTDDDSSFSGRRNVSSHIWNVKKVASTSKNQCRSPGLTKKSLMKAKQTSLKDLFGFNFVMDQVVRFYDYLKSLFHFPSIYGN